MPHAPVRSKRSATPLAESFTHRLHTLQKLTDKVTQDAYLAATGLPTPLRVSSGYGLHCYWVFTEAVDGDTWMGIARLQRAAWQHRKL